MDPIGSLTNPLIIMQMIGNPVKLSFKTAMLVKEYEFKWIFVYVIQINDSGFLCGFYCKSSVLS